MTTDLEFTVSISREEYQSATKELAEFNALLMKYGLMEKTLSRITEKTTPCT